MPTYHITMDDGRAYDIEADRQPTPEEASSALQDFHSRPTAEQSLGGGLARGAAPGIAGWLGGTGGAAAGAALAPETGGLSLLLPVVGAIAGGLTGYSGAKTGQDYLANKYVPNSVFSTQAEQRDVQTNPYSEMTGNLLSAGGLPNPASLLRGGESVLTTEGRQVLRDTLAIVRSAGPQAADPKGLELLNNVLHIAGNSGVGVAQGGLEGQNPGDIALNTAGMMLFNEGWLHHPDHGVNTETFRNAVGESEAQNQPGTPPQSQNAPEAVSEPLAATPELDALHQKAADQITNNPVAKVQDQLVDQLSASGAPQTAEVLNQTKEESRDMDMLRAIHGPAEEQAQLEHDAEQEQYERLIKEDEERGIAEYEKNLKDQAAEASKAPAGEAAEGVGEPTAPAQEVIPEDISGTQPVTQPNNEENIQGQKAPDDALQGTQGQEGKIVAATFEHKGQLYEGATHLDAIANSGSKQKSRYKSRSSRENERFGFTLQHPDGTTETIDRQKANEIAGQNGQLDPGAKVKDGMLHSDHLKGDWAQPEEDRPVPPLNQKDEFGVPLFESREEFLQAYEQERDVAMNETEQEFLHRKGCE